MKFGCLSLPEKLEALLLNFAPEDFQSLYTLAVADESSLNEVLINYMECQCMFCFHIDSPPAVL